MYPGTTSFRPPKKYFMLFYLLSGPIVLVIALYYLSGQEQKYRALKFSVSSCKSDNAFHLESGQW